MRLLTTLLFVVYLVNGLFYMWRQSVTWDEPGHMSFGIRMLKGSTQRADRPNFNSKMPVSALNALPRAFEQLLDKNLKKTDDGISDIMHGRYVTFFFSVFVGFIVFKWARELYGPQAGLFALFLFVFCPNCMANAVLVTTDTYSVTALLLVLYYLWKYLSGGKNRDFLLFCLFTGLAQLVKQSLIHIYVIIACLLVIHHFMTVPRPGIRWKALLMKTGLFVLINLLVINAGFYFQGVGTPLGSYHFISASFQGLQKQLSFAGSCPLPLPTSFIEGLDMAKYYLQLGGGHPGSMFGNITILGHSSTGGSFWYYYFVICFFKTPIPILILLSWSVWRLARKGNLREIARNELFLLLPVVYFFILMDFFYSSQTSIRQISFIYPLLYIFCGILLRDPPGLRQKWIIGVLSAAYVASVLFYWGNYIPYTNEFILDKKMAYEKVGAANLNFNQGQYFLNDYFAAHPEVSMATSTPRPGLQVVAIHDFLDIWNEHHFDWLKPFRPVGHIAHYYLIFDITPDEINKH